MATLSYSALTSLDGFIEDQEGRFDWAMPDAEVHAFVNDLERPIGTHLYGRRMYETMAVWQSLFEEPDVSDAEADFAEMWRALATRSCTPAPSTPCGRRGPGWSASSIPGPSAG